ncbi:sulfotransferase [Alteromonas sp. 1_MG-2023]|uniref:sulfotransferase n=1 Tax=Alteromonas sp. 1_MG-2023 TaxID=3062669 RepID=UPI0026E12239|nr:sulfotransferase [Alteromonas sp. 1_MG-2023]MDO6567880.1 sulfotransferase [Alteromonas sp. 1_MG-2023]
MTDLSHSKQPIICLTSLSRSGSTVFSMALACHENLISLGEVYQVLRMGPTYWLNRQEHLCSCGAPAHQCEFWQPVLTKMRSLDIIEPTKPSYYPDAYSALLGQFAKLYSSEYQPIDTSKGIKHLKLLAGSDTIDAKALFLIRDVRSYASSQARLARSQPRKGLKKVKGHYWYQMLRWLTDNKKRESLLKELALPFRTIGYEPFCFNPSQTLDNVYEFLALPKVPSHENMKQSTHHVLFGNPMRNCDKRKSEIRYDDRWFSETKYMLPAALMPTLMQYNQARVYAKL